MAIQHQIKSKYSTSENYRWQGKFYNARLFFVVLGVQNWVPIEHGHIYHIINTSDNTTQRNVKTTHPTSAEKIIWTQVCLFCFLFCCCFFSFNIFKGGRGLGLDLFFFCFFFGGGGGWNTTQRDVNAIHRTSECYSWQRNLIAGGLFFFVFLFFCFLFLLFFRGRGLVELFWGWWTGYRLSQLCSEHCITENFSAISFLVCFAFCCGLACLVFLFF